MAFRIRQPLGFLLAFRLKSKTNTKRMLNVIDRSAFQDPCDFDSVPNGVEWLLFFPVVVATEGKPKLRRKTVAKAKEKRRKKVFIFPK